MGSHGRLGLSGTLQIEAGGGPPQGAERQAGSVSGPAEWVSWGVGVGGPCRAGGFVSPWLPGWG